MKFANFSSDAARTQDISVGESECEFPANIASELQVNEDWRRGVALCKKFHYCMRPLEIVYTEGPEANRRISWTVIATLGKDLPLLQYAGAVDRCDIPGVQELLQQMVTDLRGVV